jgi:hypothetical protein
MKSDYLDETAVNEDNKRIIYTYFRLISREKTFIDKTVSNVLKIRFLSKIFPDSKFIFIFRRGEDTVNSLINGWEHERFVSPWFREIKELENWHFVLLPNWKDLANKPIPVICAKQWIYCNSEMLRNKGFVSNKIGVKHENFVEKSVKVTESALNFIGVPMDEETLKYATELKPVPSNVVTAPKKDKWKEENKEKVESILELIKPMNEKLGYI